MQIKSLINIKKFIKFLYFSYYFYINRALFFGENITFNNAKVKGFLYIKSLGSIELGENVKINSGQKFNPIGGDSKTNLITTINGKIKIGANTGMSNCTIFSTTSITIGSNVKIGGSVKVFDTDFHSLNFLLRRDPILDKSNCISRKVTIGNDAFIGYGVIILKGVNIGDKSIVAAGSVVTKNIPPKQIWAGNPAKFIRDIN